MENHVTYKAEQFVTDLLKEGLTEDHQYHDFQHTMYVRDASMTLGRKYELNQEELELLELAALFHDTGFTQQYENHEEKSKEIAAEFLRKQEYPPERIKQVNDLIDATKLGVIPKSLLQKVLKDADFNTFGNTYMQNSMALRHEWEVFQNVKLTDEEWLQNNMEFWNNHEFYTGEAQAMFGREKRQTLKKFKKQMEKGNKSDNKKDKVKSSTDFSLNSSKSAQMMFKTTLRNQIDLTNIADNKANIMLTINSGLITVGITLIAGQIKDQQFLIYPFAALMTTCVLTIIFATLATRPAKMGGTTPIENIDNGNTNLFFFGNFFKMSQPDYRAGLKKVVENDDLLDKTIVNDLYYLGLSLGRKYSRLHTTYSVFMFGMVITVIVYAIAFTFLQ